MTLLAYIHDIFGIYHNLIISPTKLNYNDKIDAKKRTPKRGILISAALLTITFYTISDSCTISALAPACVRVYLVAMA